MAAYTALVSLMNTLDNINNHSRFSTSFNNTQIQCLRDNLDFFLEFVESGHSFEGLESQIASAAHAAEDLIESHIADQLLAEYSALNSPNTTGFSWCLPLVFIIKKVALKIGEMNSLHIVKLHLQKILEEMEPMKGKVREVMKKARLTLNDQHELHSSIAVASSSTPTTKKTSLVGFDIYLLQLLDRLTGQQSDRQIIPITGMGGIGKTTLARNAYENLLTVQYFDVRAWVTISQEYNVSRILLEILSCLGVSSSGNEDEHKLGENLHKFLAGRRYLITLDDMWSIEVWDKVKIFFPDYHNRSRIILTTRISSVANYFGSLSLALDLLDGDQSWHLFCEIVFGKEVCPPDLEEIGRNIVKRCSGLPLSIVVIGGLLRKMPRSYEHWEYVARDLSSILGSAEDGQCFNVVSLSYEHLPMCLKPCFLYFGVFREDYKIPISSLIRLWVSEGFVKPHKVQSLEKVAEGYIKDLVDRNLLVLEQDFEGTLDSCMIHDLVRDFCVKVAQKEKVFHVVKKLHSDDESDMMGRRIVVQSTIWEESSTSPTSLTRSIIFSQNHSLLLSSVRLLRVIQGGISDLQTMYQQFNLRFVSYHPYRENVPSFQLPSSISLFWNLQTLYISSLNIVNAPPEIWNMRQLRHIECDGIFIPNPPQSDERGGIALQNLQTLKKIYNFSFSEEACKRIPNMKDLKICHYDSKSDQCHYNLHRLDKVESLCLSFYVVNWDRLAQNLSFPLSLKTLSLYKCRIHCKDLTMIGSLPHLEVLSLLYDAVMGPEWNPVEGEFLRLKHLKVSRCYDLIHWSADNSHFPVLEKLVLKDSKLTEIPSGIGEIMTLEYVRVSGGSCSLAVSAARLLEERESLGDDDLQVRVKFYSSEMYDEFKEMVEEEVLTSLNLLLITRFR